jgi:hypothetical protein
VDGTQNAICTSPAKDIMWRGRWAKKNEAFNYLDSVLTEVGDRCPALAEADPL